MTSSPTRREAESYFASENHFGVNATQNSRVVFALGDNNGLFAGTRAPTGSPIFSASDLEVKHGSAHLQPLCPKCAMVYLHPCEILVIVGRPVLPVAMGGTTERRQEVPKRGGADLSLIRHTYKLVV